MKKNLSVLLAVVALALGAALFAQSQSAANLRSRLAESEQRTSASLAEAERQIALLREQNAIFKSESDQLRAKLAERSPTATAPNASEAVAQGKTPVAPAPGAEDGKKKKDGGMMGMMKGMAEMMKDPDTRQAMHAQQKMGLAMFYGDLAKEIGLTPEEAAKLMDVLADRQIDIMAKMFAKDGGKADPEAAQQAVTDYQAKIKELIGADRMKNFDEYERSAGDRMQLGQLQQTLTGAGMALEDGQRQGLLQIMRDERSKTPPGPLDQGNKDVAAAMKAMESGEGIEEAFSKQRQFNERVLARAREVLTPDQMTAFETAQKQQMQMQQMGIKMSKQMFGGEKGK